MLVFTDCRLSPKAADTLALYGHAPLPCPPHPALDPAIASHPDMLLFITQGGIFSHAELIPALDALHPQLPLIPIAKPVLRQYPHDVLLNAARVGSYLLCRPDAVADELLAYAKKQGLSVLPVRQGYAKCNTCIVSDHAVITEDASIEKALASVGFDVLRIPQGHVQLAGYPYGFIGGASGNDGTHVFFCGDLSLHPDGARMADFCAKHGKQAVSLSDQPLTDVGSLLFFDSAPQK